MVQIKLQFNLFACEYLVFLTPCIEGTTISLLFQESKPYTIYNNGLFQGTKLFIVMSQEIFTWEQNALASE